MKQLLIGITGASGAPYIKRVIEKLATFNIAVTVVLSKNGEKIFKEETGVEPSFFIQNFSNIVLERDSNNFYSPFASGGNDFDVLICPASMGFLGRCAAGLSSSLLERAVDVALKEKRRVIFAVRESPYNMIHLENMLRLAKSGAVIMPLSPFFYTQPKTIEDLLEGLSDRILKILLEDYQVKKKWGS